MERTRLFSLGQRTSPSRSTPAFHSALKPDALPSVSRFHRRAGWGLGLLFPEAGRAACRGRGEISVGAVLFKKKKKKTARQTTRWLTVASGRSALLGTSN